jgi:hypothetical protein
MEQVDQVLSFLDELFEPSLVTTILTTCPRILRKNVDTQLQPTIQFLQTLYPDDMFVQAISRNPHLLLSSGVEKAVPNHLLDTYLLETLGLTRRNLQTLRTTAPFVFRIDLEKIQKVVEFLQDIFQQADLADAKETKRLLTKIIMTHPSLLNLNVTSNLQPRVAFLMQTCQLKEREVATLVKMSSGNVLGLAVDANLRPKFEFLTHLFQRECPKDVEVVLKKCILGHPQLLALSLQNIQTKVDYLDAIDTTLACRVAMRAPAVYSLSLKDNIIPTVEFLAKVWGVTSPTVEWHGNDLVLPNPHHARNDTNSSSLASMLMEYPSILTMSLQGNIQPTLTFFNRTGYTYLDENYTLQNHTTARPIRGRYIGASLFNRLLPRWHHVISKEWPLEQHPVTGRPDPSSLPPLHLLVGATDEAFCEQLGYDYHEYVAFKDQSVPRLKFSSQFDTWLKTGRPIDV